MALPRPPRGSTRSDFLEDDVPDVAADPSDSERLHAISFGDLIDKAIAGRTPPALSSDERALLEVATVLRAAAGEVELEGVRQDQLIEEALDAPSRAAADERRGPSSVLDVPELGARRRRALPWLITGATSAMAAAAMAALWLRVPHERLVAAPTPTPARWSSRPADEVVGEIRRDASGDAAARLDSIYADRLEGYREVTLFQRGGPR
ncbi:MAG: hypothetical protein R3B48_09375 [Kofleriaceae bacterium]